MTSKSILKCSEGQLHALTYLGRKSQAYRCQKCGTKLTKAELQRDADA